MKINIGVSLGNIVGYEISKRWEDITFTDVREIVDLTYPDGGYSIYGWAPTDNEEFYISFLEDAIKEGVIYEAYASYKDIIEKGYSKVDAIIQSRREWDF